MCRTDWIYLPKSLVWAKQGMGPGAKSIGSSLCSKRRPHRGLKSAVYSCFPKFIPGEQVQMSSLSAVVSLTSSSSEDPLDLLWRIYDSTDLFFCRPINGQSYEYLFSIIYWRPHTELNAFGSKLVCKQLSKTDSRSALMDSIFSQTVIWQICSWYKQVYYTHLPWLSLKTLSSQSTV